jgi:hypothetical protein
VAPRQPVNGGGWSAPCWEEACGMEWHGKPSLEIAICYMSVQVFCPLPHVVSILIIELKSLHFQEISPFSIWGLTFHFLNGVMKRIKTIHLNLLYPRCLLGLALFCAMPMTFFLSQDLKHVLLQLFSFSCFSDSFQENVFLCYEVRVEFHSFLLHIFRWSPPFLEKTTLSSL